MDIGEIKSAIEGKPVFLKVRESLGRNWGDSVQANGRMALREALVDPRIEDALMGFTTTLTTTAGTTQYEFDGDDAGCRRIQSIVPPASASDATPKPLKQFLGHEHWLQYRNQHDVTVSSATSGPVGYYPLRASVGSQNPLIVFVPGMSSSITYTVYFIRKYSTQAPDFTLIGDEWTAHLAWGVMHHMLPDNITIAQYWAQALEQMRDGISPTDDTPDEWMNPDREARNSWLNHQYGQQRY